jgi:SAM-dependent methyltransferase
MTGAADFTRHWDDVYRRTPVDQLGWYEETPVLSLEYIDRCGLDPTNTIVDAGAGASRLADALLSRGFRRLVLVDISDVALENLRTRLGNTCGRVTYVAGDLRNPHIFDSVGTVHLWHDRAALHFLVDAQDRAAYIETLGKSVVEGGHVILGAYAPEGPDH